MNSSAGVRQKWRFMYSQHSAVLPRIGSRPHGFFTKPYTLLLLLQASSIIVLEIASSYGTVSLAVAQEAGRGGGRREEGGESPGRGDRIAHARKHNRAHSRADGLNARIAPDGSPPPHPTWLGGVITIFIWTSLSLPPSPPFPLPLLSYFLSYVCIRWDFRKAFSIMPSKLTCLHVCVCVCMCQRVW